MNKCFLFIYWGGGQRGMNRSAGQNKIIKSREPWSGSWTICLFRTHSAFIPRWTHQGMSAFFLGSSGMNWNTICLFQRSDSLLPMNQEKRHPFLIFTMIQIKNLSKILRETLWILNSIGNGFFTSFYVLITARVICLIDGLLFDSGNRELNWQILAGFNEGKYDTVVNIMP